jgi:hypothetical protein
MTAKTRTTPGYPARFRRAHPPNEAVEALSTKRGRVAAKAASNISNPAKSPGETRASRVRHASSSPPGSSSAWRYGCRCPACSESQKRRARAWREQNRERVDARNAARRKPPAERACVECGEMFVAVRADRVICSRRCKDRRYRRLHPDEYVRGEEEALPRAAAWPPCPLDASPHLATSETRFMAREKRGRERRRQRVSRGAPNRL